MRWAALIMATRFALKLALVLLAAMAVLAQSEGISVSNDELKIYESIIPTTSTNYGKFPLIISTTVQPRMHSPDYLKGLREHEYQEAIEDLGQKSKKIWNFDGLPEKYHARLISQAAADSYFAQRGGGWKKFYQNHPNASGLFRMSVVGFSRDRTATVIYTEQTCDWLCAAGGIRLFRRDSEGWKEVEPSRLYCGWIA
jgi:hypothetical protein